jgi:hypothetical protein
MLLYISLNMGLVFVKGRGDYRDSHSQSCRVFVASKKIYPAKPFEDLLDTIPSGRSTSIPKSRFRRADSVYVSVIPRDPSKPLDHKSRALRKDR